QAASDSRVIYTAKAVSGTMTQMLFNSANATTLGIATATITAIRTGNLGGIDRSIPAIIPASTIAGSATPPTVADFGALDGMIHPVCTAGTVGGKTRGDELWPFIPPSQLSNVVAKTGGVDGSPSVGDAFISVGGGINQWRTLLAIPDGNYAGGTLDVLDVT